MAASRSFLNNNKPDVKRRLADRVSAVAGSTTPVFLIVSAGD